VRTAPGSRAVPVALRARALLTPEGRTPWRLVLSSMTTDPCPRRVCACVPTVCAAAVAHGLPDSARVVAGLGAPASAPMPPSFWAPGLLWPSACLPGSAGRRCWVGPPATRSPTAPRWAVAGLPRRGGKRGCPQPNTTSRAEGGHVSNGAGGLHHSTCHAVVFSGRRRAPQARRREFCLTAASHTPP
jgi:hypothetical protein